MSYKISAKNRKLKRKLISLLNIIKFKSLNITLPYKIILFGVIVSLFGLFGDWYESIDSGIKGNAFSYSMGITGYIIFLIQLIIIFLIFSINKKDIIKNALNIIIKENTLILTLSIANFLILINSLFIIKGLSLFTKDIIIGSGIIFAITGAILSVFGAIFSTIKTKENILINSKSNEDELSFIKEDEKIVDKNNMKLPF